mmetsp:Transcript_68194/g.199518  ORF Transcript_68194/g.199518 Transcript_68194/m.199518 type:complete len:268 (-) Transcript_68194:182-985(-)
MSISPVAVLVDGVLVLGYVSRVLKLVAGSEVVWAHALLAARILGVVVRFSPATAISPSDVFPTEVPIAVETEVVVEGVAVFADGLLNMEDVTDVALAVLADSVGVGIEADVVVVRVDLVRVKFVVVPAVDVVRVTVVVMCVIGNQVVELVVVLVADVVAVEVVLLDVPDMLDVLDVLVVLDVVDVVDVVNVLDVVCVFVDVVEVLDDVLLDVLDVVDVFVDVLVDVLVAVSVVRVVVESVTVEIVVVVVVGTGTIYVLLAWPYVNQY